MYYYSIIHSPPLTHVLLLLPPLPACVRHPSSSSSRTSFSSPPTIVHKIILVSRRILTRFTIPSPSTFTLMSLISIFFPLLFSQEQNLCLVFSPCLFYQTRQPESPAMRFLISITKLDSVCNFGYTIEEKRSPNKDFEW